MFSGYYICKIMVVITCILDKSRCNFSQIFQWLLQAWLFCALWTCRQLLDSQTRRLTDSWTHRRADSQILGLTDAQTHQLLDSQTCRLTNSWTHRSADSQTLGLTDAQTHKLLDSQTCRLTNSWTHRRADSPTLGLTDAQTHTRNILWHECFVLGWHTARETVIKQDGHATAIGTSCVGANNTSHERHRWCCKEASLIGRTVKALEWLCSSATSQ